MGREVLLVDRVGTRQGRDAGTLAAVWSDDDLATLRASEVMASVDIAGDRRLGCSRTRLVLTVMNRPEREGGRGAWRIPCVGVGQGLAMAIEAL